MTSQTHKIPKRLRTDQKYVTKTSVNVGQESVFLTYTSGLLSVYFQVSIVDLCLGFPNPFRDLGGLVGHPSLDLSCLSACWRMLACDGRSYAQVRVRPILAEFLIAGEAILGSGKREVCVCV